MLTLIAALPEVLSKSCTDLIFRDLRLLVHSSSSTALEFLQALRITTDHARVTTIASLYQAGEPLYRVFDKVCVMYEGRMAYFGPADRARQYFIDIGYEPANRQTTADFLVSGRLFPCIYTLMDTNSAVRRQSPTPNARVVRAGYKSRAPRTAAEFAAYYNSSSAAQLNREDMERYRAKYVSNPERMSAYRESVKAEHAKTAPHDSPFIISIPMQLRAVIVRRVQILKGGIALQVIQLG